MTILKIEDRWFIDNDRRKVILRGVNLSGSSKIPFQPDGATHLKENWPPIDLKNVTFKGRPLKEEEADEHFSRLKAWGFNCFRFLVTWEAIEHEGPYQYDTEYLDYIGRMVKKAGDYGFYIFIDPHQDVWSRVTGGDGMPIWLFDKIGLDYTKFDESGLTANMQYLWDSDPKKNKYKKMQWGENYKDFTNGTMWTLFFGGKDFAPNLRLKDEITGDDLNIQDYMQTHYIKSLEEVAKRVKDQPHVLGFDSLNEPDHGFIGQKAITRKLQADSKDKTNEPPMPGLAFTPVDGMFAAAGNSFDLEIIGIKILKFTLGVVGKKTINPKRISLWKPNAPDFWKEHGVWYLNDKGFPACDNDDYFRIVNGKHVEFLEDYLLPFASRVAEGIRKYNLDWMIFVEDEPDKSVLPRQGGWAKNVPANMVNTYHWYEPVLSIFQRFLWPLSFDITNLKLIWGIKGTQKMYTRQLSIQPEISKNINGGNCPCLVGEFGCHMNLQNGKCYKIWKKTHDQKKSFKWQIIIFDLMYNSMDKLFLNSTQWNYTAENINEFGDLWNLEDLSLFSRDQQDKDWKEDINSGGRAIEGFCRPYARKIAGEPLKMEFNRKKGIFIFEFIPDYSISAPTEVFVPNQQFPDGCDIQCDGTEWEWNNDHSLLYVKSVKNEENKNNPKSEENSREIDRVRRVKIEIKRKKK